MNIYPLIEAEKADDYNSQAACEFLQISRAAYYARRTDQPTGDACILPRLDKVCG